MLMMALLPPGGMLGGYAGDPDRVNGSWETAYTCVSTSMRVRVALATDASVITLNSISVITLYSVPRNGVVASQAVRQFSPGGPQRVNVGQGAVR